MTKFYIATFLLSVGILGIGYSQSCTRSKAKDARTDLGKLTNEHTRNTPQHQQIKPTSFQQQAVGNPYLDENFVAGTVAFYNAVDKPNRFAKMRFNAFTNTLEITAGGRFSYIQGSKIKRFTLKQKGEEKVL